MLFSRHGRITAPNPFYSGVFLAAILLLVGCWGPTKARQYASLRSSCTLHRIAVLSHQDDQLMLDVCGVYEDWQWDGINGWTYLGPSANQPRAPRIDSDGDQIFDDIDACPTIAGIPNADPQSHGCPPPPDSDGDGFADAIDACPNVAGVAHADPKKHGCPPPGDADGDKITDDVDACPQIAGISHDDPKKHGCPGDRDRDSFRDDMDACPDVPGVKNDDPSKNGCPVVQVINEQIVINQQILFATAKATIKKVSDPLLDQIAKVMKEHPEILRIEIQGHTDDQGAKEFNKDLSRRRARAVRTALTKRGIKFGRLSYKGFGMSKPLVENTDDASRQKNRRVQFMITKRKKAAKPDASD